MKKYFLILLLLTAGLSAYGFENSLFNLESPSTLEGSELEFQLKHRMALPVYEDFLGGAQVGLGLRWSIIEGLDTSVQYYLPDKEFIVSLGYTYHWEPALLYTKLMAQYYTYTNYILSSRIHSAYFSLSVQTEALWDRLVPSVNLSYDLYTGLPGLGLGLKCYILKWLAVLGEFYPYLGSDPLRHSAMAFGLELEPNGHHFKFQLGNDYGLGSRRWEDGTTATDWYFGFNIERRFIL